MESEAKRTIGVFELLDHLKETDHEKKSEIPPFDRNFKDEPKQKAMSYVELDRGILLPLKAKPHIIIINKISMDWQIFLFALFSSSYFYLLLESQLNCRQYYLTIDFLVSHMTSSEHFITRLLFLLEISSSRKST
ncbi:hypothetical protein B9Z55_005436 [Caenorhabditis nigoni]|uniref:Uncharacterized protein n=1 Tax=Caenorhabditis nigoni TaxID=1611254 RepID=A0A2G5V0U0_9PELO|nr:hypothetical protein B9Z55_005436 [Caenorhabditis nigoni]